MITMTATANTTGGDNDGNGGSGGHTLVYFVLSSLNITLNFLMHLCDLVPWLQITK